jgi:cytidine deaminase
MNIQQLLLQAKDAIKYSYAPYSSFNVGAALLCKDGTVYKGCNIENAAFSPSICAERTAFSKAISDGKKDFEAILIIGGKNYKPESFCPPCGVCRQVMNEFCDKDFKIILADKSGKTEVYSLEDMLPNNFSL